MVWISSMLTIIDWSSHHPVSLLNRSISVIGRSGTTGLSQSNLPTPARERDLARLDSPTIPNALRSPTGMAEAMRNIKLLPSTGMSAVVMAIVNTPFWSARWRSTNLRISCVLPEPGTPSIKAMPPLGSAFWKTYSA